MTPHSVSLAILAGSFMKKQSKNRCGAGVSSIPSTYIANSLGGENMSEETNEVLEKAASTGAVVSGGIGGITAPPVDQLGVVGDSFNEGAGILNPEQSRKFIEYIFEQQVLARDGRRVTMRANTAELEKLNVGERVIRAAAQADPTFVNADVRFTKVEIRTSKIRLDWEVSTEALEDNIEGATLEDTLVRTMTRAFANDLEDLAINGTGSGTNSFLNILEGFVAKETTGNSATYGTDVEDLQKLVLAMPRKYRASRSAMKFYADTETVAEILNGLGSSGNLNTERIVERVIDGTVPQTLGAPIQYRLLGLPLVEVPLMPSGYVSLTFPQNRIWGFQRDVTVHREFKPKKDTVEYTVFVRFGVQIEETDAVAFMQE
jgi:HK97 family phage major capsid protein